MKFRLKNALFKSVPLRLISVAVIAALLRIPFLDRYPPALYSDEVAQGYNAYSILKTGRDEYGTFMPLSFRSFGEWKLPVQTYLMIPTIAFFGLNPWGVRLPSAILGTLSIVVIYFLVFKLGAFYLPRIKRNITSIWALAAASTLTLSPWHVLQSRAALHGAINGFFFLCGLWCFFKGFTAQRYWYLAALFFVGMVYTYYGMLLTLTILILGFLFLYRKELLMTKRIKKNLLLVTLWSILLVLPYTVNVIREPQILFGRAKYVSIFYDQSINLTIWQHQTEDGARFPILLARYFHNKPYYYLTDFVRRFFHHLDGNFIFLRGDTYQPFQIPNMGVMYLIDGGLILFGLWFLKRKSSSLLGFILLLLCATISPAALTFLTPSTNRSFLALIPLMILISTGIVSTVIYKQSVFKPIAVVSIYILCSSYFVYQYFVILPHYYTHWWHYGYRELIAYINSKGNQYEQIVISGRLSAPYIFLLFYNRIDPFWVQTHIVRDTTKDEFGFEHVDHLGKYYFPRHFSWEKHGQFIVSRALLITTPHEFVGQRGKLLHMINYPDGEPAYHIYEIE